MKNIILKIVSAAVLAASAGCATSVYKVSESAPVRPIPSESAASPARNPVAVVRAKAVDAGAASLSAAIKASVEADLVSRGFDVNAKVPADTDVALKVSRREKARLDDWRAYEGTAEVKVTEAASGKLLGSTTLSSVGQRALDEKSAETSVANALAPQVRAWLAKTVVAHRIPMPTFSPAVMMLTIRPADAKADPAEALVMQRRFMDAVASRQGVVSCRLAQEDPASRSFVFRVEYEPQSFPGGLLNTIVLENPSLDGKVLRIVR